MGRVARDVYRLRYLYPRPICRCGCGETVPVGNAYYVNRAHERRDTVRARAFAAQGASGASKGWQPGGKNRANYVARVRARLHALVPPQETFTRDDVLLLCNRARTEGYKGGVCWQRGRMALVVKALKVEIAELRRRKAAA